MLKCADDSLYTGITTDLKRRLQQHNNTTGGAKYTRAKRPVILVYQESADSRSSALKREAQIKKLARTAKERLIRSNPITL